MGRRSAHAGAALHARPDTAGLASLVGYAVFNGLLSRYPSAMVVPWVLLAPVVAMVSAWLLLGQRPNPAETLGGALMLGGLAVATLMPSRPQAVPPPLAPSADESCIATARRTRSSS